MLIECFIQLFFINKKKKFRYLINLINTLENDLLIEVGIKVFKDSYIMLSKDFFSLIANREVLLELTLKDND